MRINEHFVIFTSILPLLVASLRRDDDIRSHETLGRKDREGRRPKRMNLLTNNYAKGFISCIAKGSDEERWWTKWSKEEVLPFLLKGPCRVYRIQPTSESDSSWWWWWWWWRWRCCCRLSKAILYSIRIPLHHCSRRERTISVVGAVPYISSSVSVDILTALRLRCTAVFLRFQWLGAGFGRPLSLHSQLFLSRRVTFNKNHVDDSRLLLWRLQLKPLTIIYVIWRILILQFCNNS